MPDSLRNLYVKLLSHRPLFIYELTKNNLNHEIIVSDSLQYLYLPIKVSGDFTLATASSADNCFLVDTEEPAFQFFKMV